MIKESITLPGGELHLEIERSLYPLQELCTFATRRNKKRSFLFVSKVLGKHYPARPGQSRAIYRQLAQGLGEVATPALFISLAETAVALGQGVFEGYLALHPGIPALFMHSTRYRAPRPLALTFQESHSHAPQHWLYAPLDPKAQALWSQARSLILVDDELSTGRTLAQLARHYLQAHPQVEEIYLVSITDWLGPQRRAELTEVFAPRRLKFINILQGAFHFEADPHFDCGPLVDVNPPAQPLDLHLPLHWGRAGQTQALQLDLEPLLAKLRCQPGQRLLVLGSGEFMYLPFLLAEALEQRGYSVHWQSTTRSPILLGAGIASRLETKDNYGEGIANFLYNVHPQLYDRLFIAYEIPPVPEHDLPRQLPLEIVEFT